MQDREKQIEDNCINGLCFDEFDPCKRPVCRLIISNFVFLGQAYDQPLKEMYTTYSTKDLVIKRSILAVIAGISINSLIRTQGIKDMYRIYLDCQRDEIDFNLAYIPDDFDVTSEEEFDPVYMIDLNPGQAGSKGFKYLSGELS